MSSHAKSTELKVGPSERGRARWPRVLTLAFASYGFLGGMVTFFGWLLENYRLTDWQGRRISMKANTAILAMVMGVCLGLVVVLKRPGPANSEGVGGLRGRWWGALTLIQHLTDIDLGIDTLIFHEPVGARATAAPNRMGMPAAASFMCLGVWDIADGRSNGQSVGDRIGGSCCWDCVDLVRGLYLWC